MDYRVTWEIDIEEVESAFAAALEAHRIMLDPARTLSSCSAGLRSR